MKIPPNAIVIGVGALALVGVLIFFRKQAAAAVQAVADVNKGTAYEGTGVVGTLGNAANQASGGLFESIGSWLGNTVYDVTHPNDGVDLQTTKQATQDNFYTSITRIFSP